MQLHSSIHRTPANPANREIIRTTEPYLLCMPSEAVFSADSRSLSTTSSTTTCPSSLAHPVISQRGFPVLAESLLPRTFRRSCARTEPAASHEIPELVPVRPGWNGPSRRTDGIYNSIHRERLKPGPALDAFRKASNAIDTHGTMAVFLLLLELNSICPS